jgi:hypothetical protein
MSFASVLARMKNRGLFLAILFLLPLLRGQNSASVPPFRDPDLSPEEPAADLVGSLTLQEKVLPMRNSVPAIVPLDIPAYDWWNEAGAAWWARAGGATVFPQAIGLAATWDADLVHRVSDVISTDARVKYNDAIRQGESSRHHELHSRSRMSTFFAPREQRLRLRVSVGILLRIMRIILHSEQVSDRYGEIRSQNP